MTISSLALASRHIATKTGIADPSPRFYRDLPILIYIFYVVYTPSLIGQSYEKYVILSAFPLVVLIHSTLARDASYFRYVKHPGVLLLMASTFFMSIYLMVVQVANNQLPDSIADLRFVQNNILNLVVINVALLVEILRRRGYTRRRMLEILLWLASLQGIFCILGIIFPFVRDISYHFYEIGAESGQRNEFVLSARIFGISGDYTYGTPIYHGALAGIAFYWLLRGRLRYVTPILLALVAVALNGRTGLVVFAGMAVLSVIVIFGRRMNIIGIISIGAIAGLLLSFGSSLLKRSSPETFNFIERMVEDTERLIFRNELSGNYEVLIPDLFRTPDSDAGVIFGTGVRLFTAGSSIRTDVGFTNDLFAGGLVFMVIMYGALLYFLTRTGHSHKLLWAQMIFVFCVANFKGEFLRSSPLLFLFIFAVLIVYGAEGEDEIPIRSSKPERTASTRASGRGPEIVLEDARSESVAGPVRSLHSSNSVKLI